MSNAAGGTTRLAAPARVARRQAEISGAGSSKLDADKLIP
jgi:hypothetical protein